MPDVNYVRHNGVKYSATLRAYPCIQFNIIGFRIMNQF